RTWLDIQLARLERRAGVPLDPNRTLPAWLAGLPPEDRARFAPVVTSLEHEAWSDTPLDVDRRKEIEAALANH
ncbi:MAG: hypothetical protein QOI61_1259, partial [Actinomycetota bacterium]